MNSKHQVINILSMSVSMIQGQTWVTVTEFMVTNSKIYTIWLINQINKIWALFDYIL
jgi:hypothetical protein